MAAIEQLTPEEKALLARAWDGESVDQSGLPEDRRALMAAAWEEANQDSEPTPTDGTQFGVPNYSPEQEQMIYGGNQDRGLGELALEGVGKTLDYPGGLVRGGVTSAAEGSMDPLLQALQANPPTGKEVLQKTGINEDPGFLAGLGTELVLDPFAGGLLKGLYKGGKGVMEKGGKALYKSAFKNADRAAELAGKGKSAFSDVARKYGLKGSAETIAEKSEGILSDLARQQSQILKEAGEKGAVVDPFRALSKPAQKTAKIIEGRNILPVKKAAAGVQDVIDDLLQKGQGVTEAFTPLQASQAKTQIYSLLNDNAYSQLAKTKPGAKLFKDTARSLKNNVESAIKQTDPELFAKLKDVNKDMEALLSSRKVLAREANKEVAKNAFTSVDAPLLIASPQMAGAKKLADFAKGTSFRTYGGNLIEQMAPIAGVPTAGIGAGAYQFLKSLGQNKQEQ